MSVADLELTILVVEANLPGTVALLAAMLGLSFADSVFRIPVQVSDSLDVIVAAAKAPSMAQLLVASSSWSGRSARCLC